MSDSTNPSPSPELTPDGGPTPTGVAPAATPPAKRKLNVLGLIALILACMAFVFAVIPPTAVIAWIFAVPAIVLAIIGLTRKNQGKGTSIAAIIVGPVAWLIAIIVTFAVAAATVISDDNSSTISSGKDSGSTSTHSTAPKQTAGIGDTVTNSDGVAFTVTSMTCGLPSAPDDIYGTDKPTGQFCQVKVNIKNGSTSSIDLSSDSLTGHIGSASFDADTKTAKFGTDTYLTTVNPGLSIPCIFYVDIPKGEKLQTVELGTAESFGVGNVTVNVS